MKISHTLAIGSMVLVFGTPVSSVMAGDADAGKALYTKNCQGCHGADGKGNPAMVKALGEKGLDLTTPEAKKMSDEQMAKVIAEGAGKMPASKLNKDEQKQVLGYVKTLAK
jgi:mono/diheme cytochrome c family protein